MAPESLTPIYFRITDLAKSERWRLPSSVTSLKTFDAYRLATVKHWAIRVRSQCYEVTSYPAGAERKLYKLPVDEWERLCNDKEVTWQESQVGVTSQSDDAISLKADQIWNQRFNGEYSLPDRNCQNFAFLLVKTIASDTKAMDKDTKRICKKMPNRISDAVHLAKGNYKLHSLLVLLKATGIPHLLFLGMHATGIPHLLFVGLKVHTIAQFLPLGLLGHMGVLILPMAISSWLWSRTADKKYLRSVKKDKNKKAQQPSIPGPKNEMDGVAALNDELIRNLENPEEMAGYARQRYESVGRTRESLEPAAAAGRAPFRHHRADDSYSDPVYQGYNRDTVDRYKDMGFTVERVVAVLRQWDIGPNGGEYFHFSDGDEDKMVEALLFSQY